MASHWNNEAPLTQNLILTTKKSKKYIISGCVTRGVALPFTLKKYLKAKEELWKLKYFTMQEYNLLKYLLKETKILQDTITLELISSFNASQNIIFQKSSYKNRPIIILPRGQNPLSYYTLEWIQTWYPCLPRQGQ